MAQSISSYKFPDSLKVKEQNQTIEFRLPINLPQRVKKLFNNENQFSNIKIIHKFDKVYSIKGGDDKNKRTLALLYIFQNIDWHGKPLFDSKLSNIQKATKDNTDDEYDEDDDYDEQSDDNDFFTHDVKRTNYNRNQRQNDRKNYDKGSKNRNNSYKLGPKFQNNKKDNHKSDINNKPFGYKGEIKSIDEVIDKLSYYQNEEIKNIDEKIYENIGKFSDIIDYITLSYLNDDIKTSLFIQICNIFSRRELMESINSNQIESIYSIFFDPTTKIFKLKNFFNSAIIHFIMEEFDDFQPIFNFFHSLISVSSSNAEMLKTDIKLLTQLTIKHPNLKYPVDELIEFAEERKQMDMDSLESATSPTMNDLFFTNDLIQNRIDRVWNNFNEYKKAMIDLTKLNFYHPFKTNIQLLRNGTLDARDLYLYQNVTVNFTYDTRYFQYFSDCNLFLKFEIRVPPNWTKGISRPDWKRSERLANRSLLILSTDPNLLKFDAVCKSCAIARGEGQIGNISISLLNSGIVPVTLVSGQLCENKSYYMFEPTSSWSSIQPVLQRLSIMSRSAFPMKFIKIVTKIDFSDNYEPEKSIIPTDVLYLKRNRIKSIENFQLSPSQRWFYDELSDKQKDTLLRVDHEQYQALRYCLLHNLTLVNGAPGTGKTHLAREILRILNNVENMNPIVVISYTNHALDSILEDVLKFIDKKYVIRWGGPTKSENKNLISRKWCGRYFGKNIQRQRDNIATKKQQLKNLYNIRQMAANYIRCISSDPYNLNYYLKIIQFLRQFIPKIEEKFYMRYPLPFNEKETLYYNEYLKSKKRGIQKVNLPGYEDAVRCWLNGDNYYKQRDARLIKIFNDNQKIVIGNTENRFKCLFEKDEEEEKEEKKPEKVTETEEGKKNEKSTKKEDKNAEEEEEEEEMNDSFDEEIYGDEDMIEMIKNSYFDANIGESFQPQYVQKYIREKFDILFSYSNNSPKAMIRYLKEMSFPLTEMIKEYEKQLQKEETAFFKNETISAGVYLRDMKLIGMTSTVASCRKEALEIAGCEIVIVEEAGELTESMLSCILPKTMKRLILIGDYQQLRPKVEYDLTFNPFNYDISLFEKLVRNAMDQKAKCLFTLSIQRRMHPQISHLVRDAFYQEGIEKIMDDESTYNHGIPFGIPHRVRFIMHDYDMEKTSGRSYSNNKEAKFCAALIPFFICRGYKPEDITIISLYKGQKYEIEKEIANLYHNKRLFDKEIDSFGNVNNPKIFKVVVLDNFQGEENKVIIVSLTRSDKPGFVKNRNRALVTLSRAKEMLVVLGNRKIFGKDCKNNDLWKKISETASNISPYSLSTDECPGLAVNRCKIHNKKIDTPAFLKTPEEIIKYRYSFCNVKCNHLLSCGHRCQLNCHCRSNPPGPKEHDNYICQFRCEKKCQNNHQCEGKCGNCSKRGCPPCRVIIHHIFEKCHHEADIMCYLVTSGKAKCQAKCGKKLDRCNHTCNLTCGHDGPCNCLAKLDATCPNCNRNFQYDCGTRPVCNGKCNHVLPCGHICSNKCSECIRYGHNLKCQEACNFVFACGHRCIYQCGDKSEKHQHQLCHQQINIGSIKQECCTEVLFDKKEKFNCSVCGKECTHLSKENSINRCRCQCTKTCLKCGKRCRALTGEKCAFFCIHSELGDTNEPPEEDGPVFLFHGKHFLLLDEAIETVKHISENMIKGCNDGPVPISRFLCPIIGCKCTDPCLIGSWLFDYYNIAIEKRLTLIRDHCLRKKLTSKENNHWFTCPKCKKIFLNNIDEDISCPSCK